MIKRVLQSLSILILAAGMATTATLVIRRDVGGSGGGGSSCVPSQDTFTRGGTGDETLSDNPPESGTWGGANASSGLFVIDRANDVLKITTSGSFIVTWADAIAGSSVTVYATGVTNNTSNRRVGVVALTSDADTSAGYEARWDQAGKLDLRDAGVQIASTTMATVLGSFSSTTNYTIKLEISDIGGAGQLLKVYVNDIEATELRSINTAHTSGYGGVFVSQQEVRVTEAGIICP